ncbi:sigma-54 dependent transcriptional regulator [Desulfomonile tiedjei]|uniref:PAS domain S-box n=1 Tax=Desulfomonile tiedjei (strain ATCC 49306 / DSM 6799 / DCB-1) TaxID=706587 RepID=I4C9G4_DESTA|nr:sigma-54 dependent transcriptional regulator [Desulfomonile tiedjei]AFM26205.1 PAS domain S-box [Desulfomonile tiedjei DSM 6799]
MNIGKHILVVDDEKRNRNLLQAMLKSLGYSSEVASNGTEALAMLDMSFDLVLLDVMMPGMDGFEVTRRIRSSQDCSDIPIVMVTVLTNKRDRLEAVGAGANDFISKPVDKVELKVRMESLLKMKAAQDEIKRHRADLEVIVEKRTAALAESEERLRAIFEAAQDCIFVQNSSLQYTHVNPAVERLFGKPAADLVELTDEDLFGEEAGRHNREVAERVLRGETVEEERTRLVNGIPTTFLEIKVPIRNASGRINGLCGILRNITDRKDVQTRLHRIVPDRPTSEAMRQTIDKALLVAETDSTVLLAGESGSGKDHLARFIHEHSKRADGPYFTINCAALARELAESELFGHEAGAFTGATRRKRGLLELAEGGTLLLNEIGELPLSLQAKLLTFLDTRTFSRVGGEKTIRVSARLIAATNRDLEKEISEGRFRADLFHRLNVYSVFVPPLRQRIEDIPILARKLMQELTSEMQLDRTPEIDSVAMRKLCRYSWPGNVRELRNVLERSLILSRGGQLKIDLVEDEAFHDEVSQTDWTWTATFPLRESLTNMANDLKRSLIEQALEKCSGKRTEAARLLKISRDSLKRQMKTLGFYSPDHEHRVRVSPRNKVL